MKKKLHFVLPIFAVFSLTYLALCYLVPAFRIKLAATPLTYFRESLCHMALLKSALAGAAAFLAGILFLRTKK